MTYKTEYVSMCPHTHKQEHIQLNYIAVMQGRLLIGYKKEGWNCPMKQDCPYVERDPYHLCPVYRSAPDSPF